jgi:SnoaL-like domain
MPSPTRGAWPDSCERVLAQAGRGVVSTEGLEARVRALEAAVQELTARVRVTEDIDEIQQLQWRYINALMTTRWDDVIECFAEGALIFSRSSGCRASTTWTTCGRTGAGRLRSCAGPSGWVCPAGALRKGFGKEPGRRLCNACRPAAPPPRRPADTTSPATSAPRERRRAGPAADGSSAGARRTDPASGW